MTLRASTLSTPTRPLPASFEPFFWSYAFSMLDLDEDKKTIIVQLLNYGTLAHWRWLVETYGRTEIIRTLGTIPATELKTRARRLASVMFSITTWQYAQRGTH